MATEKSGVNLWQKNDYLILAAYFIPATVLTWGIHEYAHWLMGRALGYDMWITFNQVGLIQGDYDSNLHQILLSMAGHIVTWLQAIVILFFIRRRRHLWLYSFLFLAFWTRILAMIISLLSNPNDEARASLLLGLPMWIMPTISVMFLLILTYFGDRSLRPGWKGNVIAYVMASLMTTAVVFSDQVLFFTN